MTCGTRSHFHLAKDSTNVAEQLPVMCGHSSRHINVSNSSLPQKARKEYTYYQAYMHVALLFGVIASHIMLCAQGGHMFSCFSKCSNYREGAKGT